MKFEFKETTIIDNYVADMANRGMGGIKDLSQMIYESMLKSTAVFLKRIRKTDNCVALVVDEAGEEAALIAILTYHETESKDSQANFTLELSFNRADIPEDAVIYNVYDNYFYQIASQISLSLHGLIFSSPTHIGTLYYVGMKCLKEWLIANANENEEVVVVLPGYFTATIATEKNEQILSIIPDGQLTRTVKDDAGVEVN